ncbi:MAG: hypothetical protein RLZZ303_2622 [Candidatus Hydrogenedentota bacterium]|jgi:D-serine deaminase-like pyridoxal phosphate-dependent protein
MAHITRKEFLYATGMGASTLGLGQASARAAVDEPTVKAPVPLAELPTPALIVDGAAFDRNMATMAAHMKAHGVGLRPHAKTHKSAIIARKQLDLGAIGICCAKVSEAEALARDEIGPFLITSPLATRDKVERLAGLVQRNPDTMVVVDSKLGAELLSAVATDTGISMGVLIDLDVGSQRTGVPCGQPAVDFARYVAALPGLKVRGVQAYAGHIMHITGHEKRRQRSLETMAAAADTRRAIEDAGIPCPVFTGGGTGTFDIDVDVSGMTDLQCGSYPFMDVQYRIIGGPNGEVLDTFEPALFVWSTAISQPAPGSITIDAGIKALVYDWKKPALLQHPATYDWGGDEHGIIQYEGDTPPFSIGDRVKVFVSHCDPTVNLYDHYHVVRDGKVVETWPVTARGCSQ